MNYRPYPRVDRAQNQLERGQVLPPPRPPLTALADFRAHTDPGVFAARMQALGEAVTELFAHGPLQHGKTAIVNAIVDDGLKHGEHVHIATADGMRCARGDDTCPLPRTEPGDTKGNGR